MTKLHIDACDRMGNTLLMTAAQNNHKEVVKECLKRGARINLQNKKVMSLSLCNTYTHRSLETLSPFRDKPPFTSLVLMATQSLPNT
jgi:ankyrin repeat protein